MSEDRQHLVLGYCVEMQTGGSWKIVYSRAPSCSFGHLDNFSCVFFGILALSRAIFQTVFKLFSTVSSASGIVTTVTKFDAYLINLSFLVS